MFEFQNWKKLNIQIKKKLNLCSLRTIEYLNCINSFCCTKTDYSVFNISGIKIL